MPRAMCILQDLRGESSLLAGVMEEGVSEESAMWGHLGWALIRSCGQRGSPRPRGSLGKDLGPCEEHAGSDQFAVPTSLLLLSPAVWVLGECVCCQKFPQAEFAVRVNCNMAEERAGWAALTGVQRKDPCSSLSPCASWLAAHPDGAGLELAAPGGAERDCKDRRTLGVWRDCGEGSW